MNMSQQLQILSLAVIMSLTGCSTYRSVGVHQDAAVQAERYQVTPPLWKGDRVRYVLKDGREGETEVRAVSGTALTAGDGTQIPLEQVRTLERKEISGGKTAAAAGAGLGVGALVVVTVLSVGLATGIIAVVSGG